MDRPKFTGRRVHVWVEYADWLEAERNLALDANAALLAENSKLLLENVKLLEAAQAVVDNLSDRQRHLNGKDVMGISKLKALLDGG
jgi:hypothetical protein